MCKEVKITAEQLTKAMDAEYQKLVKQVEDAVNQAPDGAVISGSEELVRDAMARFRQKVYEKAIQLRTQAAQAAFSPRKNKKTRRWKNKGAQGVNHLTANGTIRICRTIYWSREEGIDSQMDRWLGIVDSSVSVAARELCCRVTVTGSSFRKSAENLERLGQIRVSSNRLREIVEDEGQRALKARDKGLIGPSWAATDCKTNANGPTRVMVGADGVMVPLVTQSEKEKRRKNKQTRRNQRAKRNSSAVRRRVKRKRKRYRGADNPYKEFKIATFYDQGNEHQHAVGTAGNHETLGKLMRREAAKLKFAQADEKASVSDGAEWIRKQIRVRLPMLDAMILDYYHLTEHLAKAANTCFGQGSEKAKLWREELLGLVWDEGPAAILLRIHETRRSLRSPTKREELRKLEQYVAKRVDMLDYPTFRQAGFDLGSGPTEAFCKTLTARLKGSGMRWDSPNAEGIMALAAMDQSGQWQSYWNLQNVLVA